MPGRKRTAEEKRVIVETVRARVAAGGTLVEVARKHGVHHATVSRWMREQAGAERQVRSRINTAPIAPPDDTAAEIAQVEDERCALRILEQHGAAAAAQTLVDIAEGKDPDARPGDRLKAAIAILDRLHGRPSSAAELTEMRRAEPPAPPKTITPEEARERLRAV